MRSANGIRALLPLGGSTSGSVGAGVFLSDVSQKCGVRFCVADGPGQCRSEVEENEHGLSIFNGWLTGQNTSSMLALVAKTYARSGDDTPRLLPGEWTFVRWDAQKRSCTIIASENLRDPLYYSHNGQTLALAPTLRELTGLNWIDGEFDREAFLLAMGKYRLRREFRHQSIVKNVWQVEPGSCVEISASSHRYSQQVPYSTGPLWQGTFDEAVEECRSLLRTIMRDHLARYGKTAVMLSGGLDSTTLAWLLSEQGNNADGHFAISSAASPESGLKDETHFAGLVAEHLGLPFHRVTPPPQASPYRPSARMFSGFENPSMTQRHYLYEALYDAAIENGASTVLDGVYGEMTFTAKLSLAWHAQPVTTVKRLAKNFLNRKPALNIPQWFHVRLAEHIINNLPEHFASMWNQPLAVWKSASRHRPLGHTTALYKSTLIPSVSHSPGLRHVLPFRDRRLPDLITRMPGSFLVNTGQNRALGRAILRGNVPDSIALRRSGMPFSPDYEARLVSHAPHAIERLAAFETHQVDEWLDLHWMKQTLRRIAAGQTVSDDDKLQAQTSAMAGEFLLWWKNVEQN